MAQDGIYKNATRFTIFFKGPIFLVDIFSNSSCSQSEIGAAIIVAKVEKVVLLLPVVGIYRSLIITN